LAYYHLHNKMTSKMHHVSIFFFENVNFFKFYLFIYSVCKLDWISNSFSILSSSITTSFKYISSLLFIMFSFWYDSSIYQLHDEILLDEWGKKPNNNMQTFGLPTSKFIKAFIIYKRSYKDIYKNEVQCKVRMQV